MKKLYIIIAHILAFIDAKAAELSTKAWSKKNVTKDKIATCIYKDNVALVEKSHNVDARAKELQAQIVRVAAREKADIEAKIAANEAAAAKYHTL